MSSQEPTQPTTSGRAFRVSILGTDHLEAYEDVHVVLDAQGGVVHVFDADARTHYLTLPLGSALIEWKDTAALDPRPRAPGFGQGAFERFGEQMEQMFGEMGRAFGRE